MGQASNINEPKNSSKPTNRLTALAFLEIGLFEIAFVIVGVLLLLGTINYFNLLPVSEVFPKYLGWLPRREASNDVSQKEVPSGTSRPTPTPAGFQYDVRKAEALLTQYFKDTVKPEFSSKKLEIKQGLSTDGKINGEMKYEFGSYFVVGDATISANFIYNPESNIAADYGIFIQPGNLDSPSPTVSLTNTLLSFYFINPYIISTCQTKGNISYCENLQILNDKKVGYGYGIINSQNKQIPIVFTCFVPKKSKYYNTINSCISP